MRGTAATPTLLALVLLAGATGCGGSAADAGPAEGSTATTTAAADPGAPPFPADTRPDDAGAGSGNGLGVTGVRTEGHPGFDRVTFELAGTGTPGWRVEYTKDPVYDGSGEPVALAGAVFLSVVLRGLGLPDDTGLAAYGDDSTRVPGTGTTGIAEIAPGGVFEGDQQAYVGLTGDRRPFRTFVLTDPARVVVDVQAP